MKNVASSFPPAIEAMVSLSHQDHHQPFRPVDAENQDLLDVGRAAGTGDDDELAALGRVGHAGRDRRPRPPAGARPIGPPGRSPRTPAAGSRAAGLGPWRRRSGTSRCRPAARRPRSRWPKARPSAAAASRPAAQLRPRPAADRPPLRGPSAGPSRPARSTGAWRPVRPVAAARPPSCAQRITSPWTRPIPCRIARPSRPGRGSPAARPRHRRRRHRAGPLDKLAARHALQDRVTAGHGRCVIAFTVRTSLGCAATSFGSRGRALGATRGRGSRRPACRDARAGTSPAARRSARRSSPACSAAARP